MTEGARDREAEEFERLVSGLDDVAEAGRRLIARPPRRRAGRGGNLVSWLVVAAIVLTAGLAGYRDVFPAAAVQGEGYTFVGSRPDGTPQRYPCQPIAVVNAADGMPAEGAAALQGALARVRAASGVDLVQVASLREAGDRPVIKVSWVTEAQDPHLAGHVAGYAGSQPDRDGWFTHGSVVIDAEGHRGSERDLQLILMHEFGHALGLDHVDDRDQLMHPQYTDQDGWGRGDLTGLAGVGCGAG